MALTEAQVKDFRLAWNLRRSRLRKDRYQDPGEPDISKTRDYEIVFDEFNVAVDSFFNMERVNTAREYGWYVVWVDAATFDADNAAMCVFNEIQSRLTRGIR